jgi:hypothetical protein
MPTHSGKKERYYIPPPGEFQFENCNCRYIQCKEGNKTTHLGGKLKKKNV